VAQLVVPLTSLFLVYIASMDWSQSWWTTQLRGWNVNKQVCLLTLFTSPTKGDGRLCFCLHWYVGRYMLLYVCEQLPVTNSSPIVTKLRQSYPWPQGTRWLNYGRSRSVGRYALWSLRVMALHKYVYEWLWLWLYDTERPSSFVCNSYFKRWSVKAHSVTVI